MEQIHEKCKEITSNVNIINLVDQPVPKAINSEVLRHEDK